MGGWREEHHVQQTEVSAGRISCTAYYTDFYTTLFRPNVPFFHAAVLNIPASLTAHSSSGIIHELVVKALFYQLLFNSKSQWSVVLMWTELCFNSVNKSNPESNIRRAFVVMLRMGREEEFVCLFFSTTVKLFCLCGDCSEAFSDEEWCLTFHTWCLTCLQEREYSYVVMSFLFCCLDLFFFLLRNPGPLLCPAHFTRHDVTVFVYCFMPARVHTNFCLEIYECVHENYNLSFVFIIHMWDCLNV